MPQCQSLFSAVFGFRKAVLQIFSELDETKAHMPIFPGVFQKSERERKTGTRVATPALGAAYPWLAPRGGVGPSGTHRRRPFAHIFSV